MRTPTHHTIPKVCQDVEEWNELTTFFETGHLPSLKKTHLPEKIYNSYCILKKKRETEFLEYNINFLENIDNCLTKGKLALRHLGFADPDSENANSRSY